MALSKIPMPPQKKDSRSLEERLKDVKTITLGVPTEPGYVYGDYFAKALSKADAEEEIYRQIIKEKPTHVSDIKYDAKPRPDEKVLHTVTARGYMPKPETPARRMAGGADGFHTTGGISGVGN